ncbi:hypothetical protein L207DRAFT_487560 [Hyaloscypha variabilis F]|uniref:Heterokaryon incompatibility domain-containing protein n=1 Tax=Hyaloscypha variabilis (strain UAMH 11265 / GT02V1 / F) TaxID=1149755 RepID=A0A2J6RTC8_HYAVF|nr:hypothetical protein L207DRAFT_487560 [Hyaloscypha variabilis F]
MASTFQYRPLLETEIRLLWIAKRREGDVLECTLRHFRLDTKPKYTALSYVWGNPDDTVRLTLEGCDFYVTRNLHQALLQVHSWDHMHTVGRDIFKTQGPWLLWADAICIDQKNMAERLREIPRMRNIYSSAASVLGWLGVYPPELPEARVAAVPGNFEEFTKDFFAIIALPWFSRVWIVQECAAARNDPILTLGRLFVPFDCLRCIYSLYAYRKEWLARPVDTGIGPVSEIRLWHQHPKRAHRIFDNHIATQDLDALEPGSTMNFSHRLNLVLKMAARAPFHSTIPHDMIYGVLSMASAGLERLPSELKPDYSQPFSNVCRSYASFIAKHTGDLSFLWRFRDDDNGSHFDRTQGKIPSWVPNFSNPAYLTSLRSKIRSKPLFSADGRVMSVEGVQVDTIYTIADHSKRLSNASGAFNPLAFRAFQIYELFEAAAAIQGITVDMILNAFLKSFENIVDRVYDQSESEVDVASVVFMSWVRKNAKETGELDFVKDENTENHSERVNLMIEKIERHLVLGGFFLTENGSIYASRWGYEAIQKSDILCFLSGAPSPAILRPNGSQYRFLNVATHFAGPRLEDIEQNASVWEDSKIFPLV